MPHSSAKIAPRTNIIGTTNPSAIAATWISPAERRRPTGRRSIPASSRQATASPRPTASAVPVSTSAMEIITGVVSPSVIASRRQDRAHMPRRGERSRGSRALTRRALPAARPACARASPTVTTEPVTSTAPAPERVAERLPGLGQRGGLVDARRRAAARP